MFKPEEVRRAQLRDDRKALSAMGKKGAEQKALNNELRRARERENLEERIAELAQTEAVRDGEVLPPEPPTQQ